MASRKKKKKALNKKKTKSPLKPLESSPVASAAIAESDMEEGEEALEDADDSGLEEDGEETESSDVTDDSSPVESAESVEESKSPDEPSESPDEPSESPDEPSESPDEPSESPDEPSTSPDEPSESPDEPSESPDEPSESPDEPSTSPDEPSESPDEPSESPDEPSESPDEPSTSPEAQSSESEEPTNRSAQTSSETAELPSPASSSSPTAELESPTIDESAKTQDETQESTPSQVQSLTTMLANDAPSKKSVLQALGDSDIDAIFDGLSEGGALTDPPASPQEAVAEIETVLASNWAIAPESALTHAKAPEAALVVSKKEPSNGLQETPSPKKIKTIKRQDDDAGEPEGMWDSVGVLASDTLEPSKTSTYSYSATDELAQFSQSLAELTGGPSELMPVKTDEPPAQNIRKQTRVVERDETDETGKTSHDGALAALLNSSERESIDDTVASILDIEKSTLETVAIIADEDDETISLE
ncbi:MAG: hypothetical protein K2Z81_15360, partial [Cyanobacteria bacterium]|nr:hypothetical protein [Cyanobacteriota bacterium]